MRKKVIWNAFSLVGVIALPAALTISCSSGPSGPNVNFGDDLAKFDAEMVSDLTAEQLQENIGNQTANKTVKMTDLGLDVSLSENAQAIFTITSPWDQEKQEITLSVYIEKNGKNSASKLITVYAKNSDQGDVLEVTKLIDQIQITTNQEIASAIDAELNQAVYDTWVKDVATQNPQFPELADLRGTSLIYSTQNAEKENPVAITFGEQKPVLVTISKGTYKNFADITIAVQTVAQNEKDNEDIDYVVSWLNALELESKRELKKTEDYLFLNLNTIENFGSLTDNSGEIKETRNTSLLYKIENDIDFDNSGKILVKVNKGLGTEKNAEISISVKK